MAILLSVSCSIAPEMEERVELSPKERALQVPEGFTVTSLSEKGEIKVTYNGAGKFPGHFKKSITVRTNGKVEMTRLYVEGDMEEAKK